MTSRIARRHISLSNASTLPSPGVSWTAISLIAIVVFLSGVIASFGSNFLLFVFLGLFGSVVALSLRYDQLIWLMLTLLIYITGQLLSFAHISQAHWLPYLLGLVLIVKLMMDSRSGDEWGFSPPYALSIFLLIVIFSSILNASPVAQFLVAAKNFFIPWIFCFFIARYMAIEQRGITLWKFFSAAVIAQLPFVLYQNLFLLRTGRGTIDAMVGSFGGDPLKGGASHTLTLFIVITCVSGLILSRKGFISKRWAYLTLALGGIVLALSETKIIFVLFPFALMLSALTEKKDRGMVLLRMAAVGFALAASVYMSYSLIFWGNVSKQKSSVADTFERLLSVEEKGSTFMNWQSGELTRSGALIVWATENIHRDWTKSAFGHGPGASRMSSVGGAGAAAAKYPFTLTTSSMSALLWDTGVLGTFFFALIFISGALRGYALNRSSPDSIAGAIGGACFVGLTIFAILLPYTRDTLEHPALQFFGALMLGMVYRRIPSKASQKRAAISARFTRNG